MRPDLTSIIQVRSDKCKVQMSSGVSVKIAAGVSFKIS